MAIILNAEDNEANQNGAIYDKLQEARKDAETLLRKNDSYMDVS